MARHVASSFGLIAACLLASSAQASSLWAGRWFRVSEESRLSSRSFTLTALPTGGFRYDSGDQLFLLAPGGKAVPEELQPSASVLTERLTATSLRYVELIDGKPVERVEQELGRDGRRLIGRRTALGRDGRESAHAILSVRTGSGHGLAGAWRELPPGSAASGAAPPQAPVQPYWDISEDAAGIMTWRVLATGEVLSGAADGRQHPVIGPTHPPGRTFILKMLSPRHAQFLIFDNDHLVTQTDETISRDGTRWTDLIWTPAHPEEKDRLVYRRE